MLAALIIVPIMTLDRITEGQRLEVLVWMILAYVFIPLRWIETYADKSERFRKLSVDYKGRTMMMWISSTFRLILACVLIPVYFCQNLSEPVNLFQRLEQYNGSLLTLQSGSTASPGIITSTPGTANASDNATIGTSSSMSMSAVVDDCLNHNASCVVVDTTEWRQITTVSFFVHFFIAIICYHCAVVACKLRMQVLSFAIPLAIATPAYVLTVLIADLVGWDWIKSVLTSGHPIEADDRMPITLFFFIGWIAQLIVCHHVWSSSTERLSFVERYVMILKYCYILQNITL